MDSIDVPVEVVASVADDADFIDEIRGIKVAPHRYGNWSIAAEAGIKESTHNDIIVMDSDSVFAPGAIAIINQSLKMGNLVVQPTVIFLNDGSRVSKLISNSRTHENRYEPKSYSPGLGLKRRELIDVIGEEGNIYHPEVRFGDDGYLDQKIKAAGVPIFVSQEAVIYHDPIDLKHELRTAFQFGRSEAQIERVGNKCPDLWNQIQTGYFTEGAKEYYQTAMEKYGWDTALFIAFWRMFYLSGYEYEKSAK